MKLNKRQERILGVVGLAVVGWIIYRNWTRRGNVAVESAGSGVIRQPDFASQFATPLVTEDDLRMSQELRMSFPSMPSINWSA